MRTMPVRLVFALLSLLATASHAQTVESVLNALQERQQMILMRGVIKDELERELNVLGTEDPADYSGIALPVNQMFNWLGTGERYLAPNSIPNLEKALELLNAASKAYDDLKWEFLAYDANKGALVNQELAAEFSISDTPTPARSVDNTRLQGTASVRYSSIVLPSVGVFTPENWRAKIRLLASNIEQLRALPWPAGALHGNHSFRNEFSEADPGDLGDFIWEYTRGELSSTWNWRGEPFQFPWILPVLPHDITDLTIDHTDYAEKLSKTLWPTTQGTRDKLTRRNFHQGHSAFQWEAGMGYRVDFIDDRHAARPPLGGFGFYSHSFDGVAAIKSRMKPAHSGEYGGENDPTGLRPIGGNLFVTRTGRVSAWGDITAAVGKLASLHPSLKANAATTIKENQDELTLGDFAWYSHRTGYHPVLDYSWVSGGTIMSWLLSASQLPKPTFLGSWKKPFLSESLPRPKTDVTNAPELSGAMLDQMMTYSLRQEGGLDVVGHRGDYGMFLGDVPTETGSVYHPYLCSRYAYKADMFVVAVPKFASLIVPEKGKLDCLVDYGLGEVETSIWGEPVKVHVGRGRYDLNQVGAVCVRADGFGSLRFDGSPNEFDLIYEDTPSAYTDTPLHVPDREARSFDGNKEFTQQEREQSGWESWFHYIAAWHSPRLRQVRGGDLLVDIEYKTSYRKILRFYWTGGVPAAPTGKFYTNLQNPFKTIVISNPTAPVQEAGLPSGRFRLQVGEGTSETELKRFHDAQIVQTYRADDPTVLSKEVLTFSVSDLPVADLNTQRTGNAAKQTVTVQYMKNGGLDTTIDTVEEFVGGKIERLEVFRSGFSPRESEWPVPKSKKIIAGGEERVATFTESPARGWIEQVDFSGPDTWVMTGGKMKYSAGDVLSEIEQKIGDKPHRALLNLSGNVLTQTEQLNNLSYRKVETTYSGANWTTATTKVDGTTQATHLFHDATGSTGQPWSYKGSDYPGGFKERVTFTGGLDQSTTTAKSGWGSGMLNGSEVTTVRGRYGELKNHTVTQSGVLVEKAEAVENQTTGWGAPKQIKGLRNEITHTGYEETGVHWREVKSVTDPFGVQRTIGARDWMGRPSNWTTGHGETLTPNYVSLLTTNVASSIGHTSSSTVSVFGEERSSSSSYGTGFSSNYTPATGKKTLTADGRTKTLDVAPGGILQKVYAGMGSSGESVTFGVEGGKLYTEVTPLKKDDTERAFKVRTYYDGQGRVKKIVRPSHSDNGGTVSETWDYQHTDTELTVVYQPAQGPVLGTTRTVTSAEGTTVYVDGREQMKTTRSGAGGKLTETTSIYDDSGAGDGGWVEMSKKEITPSDGSTSFTPWGLTASGSKLTTSIPGNNATATLNEGADGAGRQLRKVTLTKGLPSGLTDQADGVAKSLTINRNNGHFQNATGSSGGEVVEMAIDPATRRVNTLTLPGGTKTLNYGGGQGFSTTVTDTQGTTNTFNTDFAGNPVSKTGSRDVDWNFEVVDEPTKSLLKLNERLETTLNPYGESLKKKYATNQLEETFVRAPDGSLLSHTVTGASGIGTGTSAIITDTATSRTMQYGDSLRIQMELSRQGLPKAIAQSGAGQDEQRTLKYERLALRTEIHEDGPLKGWTVEFVQDERGRLGRLRATKGSNVREFILGYDAASRLESSSATFGGLPTAASATRNAFGQVETLSRRGMFTQWLRSVSYRLEGVTNMKGTASFDYSYPLYDSRHRIKSRVASQGTSWTNLTYNDRDELTFALSGTATSRGYGYDAAQNRVSLGTIGSVATNYLNQAESRTLTTRGFGVQGSVKPGSTLQVFNPYIVNGEASLTVHPTTGAFWGFWSIGGPQTGAILIDALVRGTYLQAGQPTAIAEQRIFLRVPPVTELIKYDKAGRQVEDAFWKYAWDGASRLVRMEAKLPAQPGTTEVLYFTSDAQGRRTVKEHVLTKGQTQIVTRHTLLWAGWLPLCEIREKTAETTIRRWFQWGPDLSGTFDGAAGIGGLVAIHEEDVTGAWKRTLLPVSDGIGNITAVLDAADSRVVAQYEYGPFGEPLGESGEADACPLRWQTKYYDSETQLYCFPKRYYDPRTGRWLSRDPLGESGGFNLYAYCGNDPVNRHDPLGLDVFISGGTATFTPILSFTNAATQINGNLWMGSGLTNSEIGEGASAVAFETQVESALSATLAKRHLNPWKDGHYDLNAPSLGNFPERPQILAQRLQSIGVDPQSSVGQAAIARARAHWSVQTDLLQNAYHDYLIYAASTENTVRQVASSGFDMAMWATLLIPGGSGSKLIGPKVGRVLINAEKASDLLRAAELTTSRVKAGRLTTWWKEMAGEWRGWKEGFADTGKYAWSGPNGIRAQYGRLEGVQPFDVMHHRILAQGGTRGGAGGLSLAGFFGEQYGRYIPNFIKNSRWNLRNMGQPSWRGGNGLHEALHGTNPEMRLNIMQRIWHGTNTLDKTVVGGLGIGLGYYFAE